MNSKETINYHLYIDECGDQNLEAFSPTFPITRHVLNPQAVNFAYDVLAPNIFMENDKLLGLKIYPSQQA